MNMETTVLEMKTSSNQSRSSKRLSKNSSVNSSLKMNRRFTETGKNPLDAVQYVKANSKIKDTNLFSK